MWPRGTWYGANDTSCIFLRLSESCFVPPSCYGSDFLLLHTSRGFSKKVRRREKGNFKGIEDFSYCQVYFSRIAFRKTKKYSASILFLSVSRSDELQKVARRTKNFPQILQKEKKLYRVRKATSIFYNARGCCIFQRSLLLRLQKIPRANHKDLWLDINLVNYRGRTGGRIVSHPLPRLTSPMERYRIYGANFRAGGYRKLIRKTGQRIVNNGHKFQRGYLNAGGAD